MFDRVEHDEQRARLQPPETIGDAFDLSTTAAAFDLCDRSLHFASSADQACRRVHWLDGQLEHVHTVCKCPREGATWDGAPQACEPSATED